MRLVIIYALSTLFLMPSAFVNTADAAASNSQETAGPELNARDINRWNRTMVRRTSEYEEASRSLFTERDKIFNRIYALRSRYPLTFHYRPFSNALVEQIERYAYIVDTSPDKIEANEALLEYNEMLKKHIVDLGVVSFALKMSEIDVRFGDEYFLKKVQDAILKSMNSAPRRTNGESAGTAYLVMTYSEEDEWLAQIGGIVKKSELFDVRGKYYNVHDIETQDGEYLQVFMDVTEPIKMTYIKQRILNQQSLTSIR